VRSTSTTTIIMLLDHPEISDYDYDMLLRELVALEGEHPQLKQPDSPTQRVGGELLKGFQEVVHRTPKLSLGNVFDEGDILDFHNRVVKALKGEAEYVLELK
jgi:DNA ligase (NAD+)